MTKEIELKHEGELSYCLYARKSSESDERQALSIDSQIKEMLEQAKKVDLNVKEIKQESHSAKNSGERPVFGQMIMDIKKGKYQAIVTWAPDRLSRNAGDLGSLVDLMDCGKLQCIRTNGQSFWNTPNDKFLLMILCSQAKLENDNKGVNVLRGMKTKCESGWRPCMAPLGYLNEKYAKKGERRVFVDPVRGPIIKELFEKVANEGVTGRKLLRWLTYEKLLRSRKEKKVTLSSLYNILKNPFYYGEYEYPVGSGKFYKGEHDPLICRQLFDQVRQAMAVSPKLRPGSKEFAFTQRLLCGNCGYGVTASEKFKKLRDGTIRKYVYYHCTNKGAEPCRQPYIREDDLTLQLVKILDTLEIEESEAVLMLGEEIKKFSAFSSAVLGINANASTGTLDVRKYAKFVLSSGSTTEKRNVLSIIKTPLKLCGGNISEKFN